MSALPYGTVLRVLCCSPLVEWLCYPAASKLPYLIRCESTSAQAMVAGHVKPDSSLPVRSNLMFVLPHVVIGISIEALVAVLWFDWSQRPRLCVPLFALVAMNSTMVLTNLGKLRHLDEIDAKGCRGGFRVANHNNCIGVLLQRSIFSCWSSPWLVHIVYGGSSLGCCSS